MSKSNKNIKVVKNVENNNSMIGTIKTTMLKKNVEKYGESESRDKAKLKN